MGTFADCQEARNRKTILEIMCPKCGEEDGIEAVLKDGMTVGECVCSVCGYAVPEGVNLGQFLEG